LQVTQRVAGFKKISWLTHENLGLEPLDLPPTEFQTTGYWFTLSDQAIESLRAAGAWTSDPNAYGPGWNRLREAVRKRDGYRLPGLWHSRNEWSPARCASPGTIPFVHLTN